MELRIATKPYDMKIRRNAIKILTTVIWLITPINFNVFGGNIGIWDRFEKAVSNSEAYQDPYRGVKLNVAYTRPDGTVLGFPGFHDGGDTWRFRMMPDQLGIWNYTASFSDGSPGVSGSFTCVQSDLPGMLTADEENPMWFGFKGGRHVLIRSFHAGDKFFSDSGNSKTGEAWSAALRSEFLDWAQAQGYNMLSIASHYMKRDTPPRGRFYDLPKLWNKAARTPEASEYRQMEGVLDDLDRRRIMVFPFAGFFGQSAEFPTDQDDQQLYLEYTIARVGSYWNILYQIAGPEPAIRNDLFQGGSMSRADINRVGEIIKGLVMPGQLVSCHNETGKNSVDIYSDENWHGYGCVQGPKTTRRASLSAGLLASHHPSRPLYAQETLWYGNNIHPDYSDADLRKNAYVINMSATALNFAENAGNSSSGFSGTLLLGERTQAKHDIIRKVWDYFETVDFWKLSPNQSLVDSGYCMAEVGSEYLVYLDAGGSVNIAIEPGQDYQVTWINARDTTDRRSGGSTPHGRNLTAPAAGDWLAHLVATKDTATGAPQDRQGRRAGAGASRRKSDQWQRRCRSSRWE